MPCAIDTRAKVLARLAAVSLTAARVSGIPIDEAAASSAGMKTEWGAVFGLNIAAMRTVPGAISFSSCRHLPAKGGSKLLKPVMLPPGLDRLATKPSPTGSPIPANTIGIDCVACFRARVVG